MKPAKLLIASLTVILFIVGVILISNSYSQKTYTCPKPGKVGEKPSSPFTVSTQVLSQKGNTRTIAVTIYSDIDLSNATLTLIPFNDLTIVSDRQISISCLAGESRTYNFDIALSSSGAGKCTAEVSAQFENGTVFSENSVLSFNSGNLVNNNFKVDSSSRRRVKVQNVVAE